MKAWMQLIRPANVLTAISDVLAGVSLACLFLQTDLPSIGTLALISVCSMLLYTGGIVYNDVFDASLDAVERPERPIPSGRIKKSQAIILATFSFVLGCLLALQIGLIPFYISSAIVVMCLLYNGQAKHHNFLGPLTMGSCRGLNLLLGVSVYPEALNYWYIAIVPIIYIAAVTNISRGEVYGNNKTAMLVSMGMYILVLVTLLYFSLQNSLSIALVFIILFAGMILLPLFKSLKSLQPDDIRKSVKFGVLALILMNASWIAIEGFWPIALIVCATLPICLFLGKKFAVT